MTSLPPLRWLSAADVAAAMPPIQERLRLAERTMTALVADADLPAKIAVHPRPGGSFGHAMPAFMRGDEPADDRLGIKWVTGYTTNLEVGLPAIHATVVLDDPATGVPVAILDGGPITAARTAAVTGLALRRWGPDATRQPRRVALVGAGVQGRAHIPMIGHVLPGAAIAVFDRDRRRATALAEWAGGVDGILAASTAATARDAVRGADVVVTAASFGPVRQVMTNEWLAPEATVVAVDYATYCAAEVANEAALFLVDERAQFDANRDAGAFDDYPDPAMTIGEAILADIARPVGRVVVTHLGVGLADVIFGSAILAGAEEAGLGIALPR